MCWWSLQKGQWKKWPRRTKNKSYIIHPKKIAISVKLDLHSCHLIPNNFIKRYTWSINLETFRGKLNNSWGSLFTLHFYIILCNKIRKKIPHSSKTCLREFSFTPYIYMKKKTWFINLKTFHWKLTISWIYSEANFAS